MTLAKKRNLMVMAGLVAAVLFAYWPVRGHSFVNYDDDDYITTNIHVRQGLTWNGIVWALGSQEVANWHPVTWLSHMIDVQVFGLNAGAHHVVSVAIHSINSVLLYLVLLQLTGVWWRCAAVTALFALHPLHVESVAWISERKDLLSTAFGLLAIAAYVRWVQVPSIGRMLVTVVCFALSLMSKPMLVTMPFVLVLLDIWPLQRLKNTERHEMSGLGRLIIEKWPLLAMSAISCVITILAQRAGGAVGETEVLPLSARVGNAIVSYAMYLRDTVWPVNLAVLYPHPHDLPIGEIALAAIVLVAITSWCLWLFRSNPAPLVGWLWFLGTLVPVIGLVQVGEQARADRYTYVPLIGVFIMVIWALPEPRRQWSRIVAGGVMTAVLTTLTIGTRYQVQFWRDSVALFERTLVVTPRNPTAHVNLGFAIVEIDQQRSAAQLTAALAIDPNYAEAHQGLGYLASRRGDLLGAERHYARAVELQPENGDMRDNLGFVLVQLGRVDEAIDQFEAAMTTGSPSPTLRIHYSAALALAGRYADAAAEAAPAIRADPQNPQGYLVLADSLLMLDKIELAIRNFRIAIDLAQQHGDAQLAAQIRAAMIERGLAAP